MYHDVTNDDIFQHLAEYAGEGHRSIVDRFEPSPFLKTTDIFAVFCTLRMLPVERHFLYMMCRQDAHCSAITLRMRAGIISGPVVFCRFSFRSTANIPSVVLSISDIVGDGSASVPS